MAESNQSPLYLKYFEAAKTPSRTRRKYRQYIKDNSTAIQLFDAIPVECMCAWMFSTLKSSMFEKLTILMTVNNEISIQDDKLAQCAEVQWRQWSCLDLSLMLISAMQHSPSPAAHFSLAFKYFDENSPLLSFLRFHEEFALRNDYEQCKKHLQDFRLNIDKCREYSFSGEIGDLCWVEQVASSMASHMLVTCPTSFERSHLLKLLAEAHFGEHFKCSVLNFNNLHQMTHALNKAGLDSGVAFTVKEHFSSVPGLQSLSEIYSCRVRVDTNYVLGVLLEKGEFEIAKQYAAIVNSTASQITIKEAEYNLKQLRKSSYWKYTKARLNFWHQCNSNFLSAKVDPDSAAEFFQFVVDSGDRDSTSVTATERALLLALILKWMTESEGFKVEQTREYEKRIWLSHIQSAIEQEDEKEDSSKFSGSPLSFLLEADTPTTSLVGHTSLLSYLSISAQPEFKGRRQLTEFMLPDNVSVSLDRTRRSMLTEKESEVFEVMLGRLMNAGLLSQARELASLFEHNSIDLVIVLICIQLSQMTLKPAELTEDVLSLMSTRQPRHFTDSCTSLLEDSSHSWESTEYVRMMSMLSDRVLHARPCCDCVITCFRIALALNVSYATIINTDPLKTISDLLISAATDKYILASKFINTCNLTAEEVASYLAKCVSSSLEASGESGDSKSHIFPSKMSSNKFQEIIQLLSDPALLGNKLLRMAKTRAASKKDTYDDICVQVELLIRAHDCYTMGCSVDGISQVLVVARNWVQVIEKGKHYQLLVRLLTGISRYHEMSYIIGMLIEHDQFENLCHSGVEKEEQFRVALIEYLHKHGNDSDKLMMVAINFNMLREQAKTTEDRAKKELASIKRSQLVSNNAETVKKLKRIFDDFRLAARMYAKENCLYHSENCLSRARLVALQLSFTATKQVVNLDGKSVMKYMEEQPFTEALIVADAYKQSVWTDWINPLYRRVIVGGDFRYLREYERAFTITATVYSELASKFQRDRERTQDTINNMKTVLIEVKNLILKQKLATQLGFQDIFPTKFDNGYMNDLQRL